MKPKIFDLQQWKILNISLQQWNELDGIQKVKLLKLNYKLPVFGKFNQIIDIKNTKIFDFSKMKELIYQNNEVGGTIDVSDGNYIPQNYNIQFVGNNNRIPLDLSEESNSTDILFHTHPIDEREFNPPSILDILLYLALIIKSMADILLENREDLIVQNCIVFAKEGVYVYHANTNLLQAIINKLLTYKNNFVYDVEKLLEEIELSYASYLLKFNKILTKKEYQEYLHELRSLGFTIELFPYNKVKISFY